MFKVHAVRSRLALRGLDLSQVQATVSQVNTPSEAHQIFQHHDVVVDATASDRTTSLLTWMAKTTGKPLVSACLQRGDALARVDRYPLRPGETHLPADDGPFTGPTLREPGCGQPVSPTPPAAVACAAELATTFAAASLPIEAGGLLLGWWEPGIVVLKDAVEVADPNATIDAWSRRQEVAQKRLDEATAEHAHPWLGYVGDWHSHPKSCPPSSTDILTITATSYNSASRSCCLFTPRRTRSKHVLRIAGNCVMRAFMCLRVICPECHNEVRSYSQVLSRRALLDCKY